ncbi:helix-turn-helix domain-containing protein [Chelativorans salis]|uniref:Helix-turn-helix transcriptional regulator n=1 Tax=Chelativorans salis TaxID=2978478 RepID=A0ABT2LRP7_9HYPH|nr:helix-turn-helix transcriptional regulator [Chelativorans sp. EGI FJ00035]MCT7376038.1 helix-turn-helix transcriptional regulator [Chelativorans sp. EGI FJ00035]
MDMERTNVGGLLREWRQRRRLSQLHLALDAGVSQRHLSFVESGRALPSRDMVLTLAESLSVPLRQRNRLLLAAGYAPSFAERALDDPALKPAMEAVQRVLDGHAPNPALAIDRHWNMLAANGALAPLLQPVEDKSLLTPPANALRVSLHPRGLAPYIVNLAEWRAHVLERLRQINDQVADPALSELERELAAYPGAPHGPQRGKGNAIAVPFRLRLGGAELSFITTTTVFGAPLDVTLSELAIESFFPADEATARFLREAQDEERTG